jgi:hypothetical protein
MKFKKGDRVIWRGTGPDAGTKGTVTHTVGKHFEVRWDADGETYSYEDWAGSSIEKKKGEAMTKYTEHTRVIAGPCVMSFDGDVARVVKLADGSGRIEMWERGVGWVEAPEGSIALHSFVPGACRPASANDAARLGCRLEDFGHHWTEEPASPRDRAKIVHMLKERSFDLAAREVPPGHA